MWPTTRGRMHGAGVARVMVLLDALYAQPGQAQLAHLVLQVDADKSPFEDCSPAANLTSGELSLWARFLLGRAHARDGPRRRACDHELPARRAGVELELLAKGGGLLSV